LLGRYIAEEHDSLRLLEGCHSCLREAAAAEAASTPAPTRSARAMTKRLTSLEGKVDTITRAVEELREIVCAQAVPVG
jgi:hypothetical protein